MPEHFIKNIEIKDFKCFEDFKAEGFSQVNLVGGKNNAGKTALMEACYAHTQQTSHAIADIIFSRYQVDLLRQLLDEVGTKYILNFIENKAKEIEGGEIISNLATSKIEYFKDDLKNEKALNNVFLLDATRQSNDRFDKWYSVVIENGLEDEVDKFIQNFDKNIGKFRIIKSQPMCSKKNNGKFYNLNEFGDGLAKFISYLLLFLSNNNGVVFLDEIDNGIHYSKLDMVWKIILTISKQQNVQVFATTHSKECIESYARVAKKLKYDEITYTILTKLEDGSIDAGIYDASMLINTISQDHEVRGW